MKRVLAIFLLIVSAAVGGWFSARHWPSDQNASSPPGTIYTCSMHLQVRSPKPGKCPFCGMDLVPLGHDLKPAMANGVMLSSNRVNAIHVQTVEVHRQPLRHTLRVAGTIDDNDVTHRIISAYIDGRIDKLFVSFPGSEVKKGQPLATFFSPMLLSAEREYLALAQQKLTNSPADLIAEHDRLVAGAAQRLRQMGLSDSQIKSIASEGLSDTRTQIFAPVSGTVVLRNVYEGQYVKEGEKLFEIADFSTMWFKFDAYERDLAWLKPGQEVQITTPAIPGKTFVAPIAFIDPNINDPTRSARLRVEIPNPIVSTNGGQPLRELLHKVFAEGIVKVEIPEVLAVPRSAVIATGTRTLVYIDRDNGLYEQRPVRLGRAGDDLWEILDGLSEGERVVTTGNMLVDAQAQLDLGGSSVPAESGKPMPELNEQQQTALKKFFAAADALSRVLAADHRDDYNAQLPSVTASVQLLKEAFTTSPAWQPLIEKIDSVLPKAPAQELADARTSFLPFTGAAVDLAKIARQQAPFRTVRIYKCPMAPKPGQTSFWLQLNGPLRNPFYGAEMIDCGSEVAP
jgi:Cu(I)/Ag(I) efflux system membrane fusion protein